MWGSAYGDGQRDIMTDEGLFIFETQNVVIYNFAYFFEVTEGRHKSTLQDLLQRPPHPLQ